LKIAVGVVVVALVLVAWLYLRPGGCSTVGRERRQAAVLDWLECIECDDGERDAVVAQRACPVGALEDALLNGPGPGRVANVRRRLELVSTPSGAVTLAQLVEPGVAGYVAAYRQRAALALGDLADSGVARAREALAAARAAAAAGTRVFPPDVLRALESAAAAASTPAFTGQILPDTAAFLDTVTVRLAAGQVVADEDVRLVGSPFGDDVLVDRYPGSDSLRFVAAGDVGAYVVTIQQLGPAHDSARAPFGIVRMPPRPQGLGNQVPIPLALPFRHYFAVKDTAEQLRLETAALPALAVSLEWADTAGARLVARQCVAPFAVIPLPMDPVRRVRGRVVNERDDPVEAADVSVPGVVGGAAVTAADGTFEIPLPPGPDTVRVAITHPEHEAGTFVLPVGLGDVTLGVRPRARAAAPGVLRRVATVPAPVPAGCWLLGVDRVGPPPDSYPTIFRFRVTTMPPIT
jgi:hypothetical protein